MIILGCLCLSSDELIGNVNVTSQTHMIKATWFILSIAGPTGQLVIISPPPVVVQYLHIFLEAHLHRSLNQTVSQQRTLTPTVLLRIIFITAMDSSLISPEIPSGDNIRLWCYLNKANTP